MREWGKKRREGREGEGSVARGREDGVRSGLVLSRVRPTTVKISIPFFPAFIFFTRRPISGGEAFLRGSDGQTRPVARRALSLLL